MGLDDIVNKAKDLAGEAADKAKEVVGDVADAAKDVAGDVTEKAHDLTHHDDKPAGNAASGGTGF